MKKMQRIFLFLAVLSFISCQRQPMPKAYGYFRIAVPDTAYVDCGLKDYPYTFQLSKNAQIIPREFKGESYWIDIVYPALNATIYCSYKPVKNNLRVLARDAQEFLFSHSRVATAIPAQEFANPSENMYGVFYDLQGNTASPIQFVLTDSIQHFFRGSVYCNAIPNQDSLAPIYNYIREDVRVLMETMKWQNVR